MTYGHRSSLREECSRFLRFAYLIDFLSLQALSKIYLSSVKDMILRLQKLDNGCEIEEIIRMASEYDQSKQVAAVRGLDPMFDVKAVLDDSVPIPESEITEIECPDFKANSPISEFNLLCHIELESEKVEEEEDPDNSDVESEEEAVEDS